MWLVMRKELLELLRDKRAMFFMVALPLFIFPLIFGGVAYFAQKAVLDVESKVLRYAVVNPEYHQALVTELTEDKQYLKVELDERDFKLRIQNGELDFVLVLPKNADGDVLKSGQAKLELYLNDASLNNTFGRLNEKVQKYAKEKRLSVFQQLGIQPEQQTAILNPIVLNKINLADTREDIGEKIGGLIPYFIFVLLLQGVVYIAADLGAGEKERGTLETLLLAPIPRHEIVLGKFFTVAIAGMTSAVMAIGSMVGWGILIGQGMAVAVIGQLVEQIGLLDFTLILLMLIPVVAIFASLTLSLSIYAKSYKEAQTYMGFLMIFVFIPIIFAMLPGVTLQDGWAWVPLTNVALALKELVKGTMDYSALLAIFASTALIAGACLWFCVVWFKREKVLFR
ncbi:ABC transporter permease [Paraneptunicella aestuarii]|uniref:ABC transporter permease n=1 Tax=Paraneptunicella aestuarii TaxID=2831148 RepID=UPI001E4D183D|nr:ABC transporter permease [Paraneptunicella aestuarii]UAA37854.1 ABC transporter permease [Paraneptunicella aestuarii]